MRTRYLELAAREALSSNDKSFRVGSLLVRGSNIIRASKNQGLKTHPLKKLMYPERAYKGLHAEVSLLTGLRPYDVENADVYVVRLLKSDRWALAKPCHECESFLRGMNIRRVFYSIEDNEYGCLKL